MHLSCTQLFLEQPLRFAARSRARPGGNDARFVPLKQRISVNMLAMRFRLARSGSG